MRIDRKTIAAGAGAGGLLGLGLYLAVPAFADDPSPSSSPSAKPHHWDKGRPEQGRPDKGRPGPHRWGRGGFGGAGGFGGVHGEATVQRKDGFHLVGWQRGKITAVSGATLTVRSDDGVSWTWTTNDKTVVRKNAEKAELKSLANGDLVMVVGERSGQTRTARMVRVPKAR
ncbi:DUF5666 domain-containing protein [Actinomadura chibensis]|uniref:DUF5666 domain-containing protein n=1 Tax=Actinomadura chibensis TaxID=392828 RepID=A0A5D0NYA5_9ACTN|nr:DUF5666 domain-containing protein [Actinomadura chibensis]TYB49456.1 hypothetical protein FXF69_10350 [Actinomadura chibensis]